MLSEPVRWVGAHYAAQTFPQLSAFFYEQAEEERGHAMIMVTYLVDRGANIHFGAIEEPRADFPDHVAPIQHALEPKGFSPIIPERQVSAF